MGATRWRPRPKADQAMRTDKDRSGYLAYMLRLRRIGSPGEQHGIVWRVSLESPQTRERFVFASLGELLTFLEQEVEQADGSDDCNLERRGTN